MTRKYRHMLRFVQQTLPALMLILAFVCCPLTQGQRVDSLAQSKALYVETFSGGSAAAQLRERLVHRLAKSHRFHIVPSPKDADAILRGTGHIWVRGYISTNVRTPSSNLQAVYGGYLSLEVVGSDGEPLWSWLVTPGKLIWTSIVDDLANQAANKLLEDARSSTLATQSQSVTLAHTALIGAGATFPAPLYWKWFEDFDDLHPGVHIHYSAIGSQLGVEKLLAGDLDFAGSDVAPAVIAGDEATSHLHRIASVLGGVVPIYNLQGVTQDLRFTPEVLAGIYLGRIKRWDDPEIRRYNQGVDLPDANIIVVHRADGSGTSWHWSDFLSKTSPAWASTVGRGTLLNWPVGVGAVHNEGVAETVKKTPNSIGYVELAYAIQQELSYGAVRNRAGEFIHASLDSLEQAVRASNVTGVLPASITDPPGKYSYPIAAFTWLVLPAKTDDPAKRAALLELFRWILTSGQKECSALGYVPLPRETAESELRLLGGP
ncbi:MAG TPA: phosphate ABC transporter substrate-binding protein PstS [Acidobacteriaceae bacterium]|nr:phosphate ABC transporter substrate-binding protein PstS [Acidobacteriaceae bacterium]